jgi:hypothetical protein
LGGERLFFSKRDPKGSGIDLQCSADRKIDDKTMTFTAIA